MNNGISIYTGLDNSLEENLNLMETAARLGIRRIFTSLHIPETNKSVFKTELKNILDAAKNLGMEVVSDISPKTLSIFDIDISDLRAVKQLGISRIRLDFGFGAEEIAKMSHNADGVFLQLNASAIGEEFLTELEKYKADFSKIDALHNFYPRQNTGLSEDFFVEKNKMLHGRGIKVSAFISSKGKKRSPIFEGLPTLENHRDIDTDLAARHLAALGVDGVFISESLPIKSELENLANVKYNEVVLKAKIFSKKESIRKLLSNTFTAREDEARDVIRGQEGRLLVDGEILPENNVERRRGSITIDNALYKRYMGETQIIKNDLPKDERVNVVAEVLNSELFMLKYVLVGKKFSFIIINA